MENYRFLIVGTVHLLIMPYTTDYKSQLSLRYSIAVSITNFAHYMGMQQ